MADPLEAVANVAHDVPIHDLRMVDVVENLHPGVFVLMRLLRRQG
jgi:hypothetical protein